MKKVTVLLLLAAVLLLASCAQKPEALFTAIKDGDIGKVRNILDLNKKLINAKKENGMTPLHEAVYQGNLDIVKALISRGADVNAQKKGGFTPLHVAAQRGHEDVASFLLKSRADASIKDEYGMTAGDIASKAGFKKMGARLNGAAHRRK